MNKKKDREFRLNKPLIKYRRGSGGIKKVQNNKFGSAKGKIPSIAARKLFSHIAASNDLDDKLSNNESIIFSIIEYEGIVPISDKEYMFEGIASRKKNSNKVKSWVGKDGKKK